MVQLGLCHWWQARYDDSVDKDLSLALCESQIERALAINPDIGAAYMLKGGNAFLRDRHEEAIAECEKAIVLAPSDSWALAFLGLVATYGGKPARAVEVLKVALRLSPHPPNWYIESFATANLWHGDMAAATNAAEENYRLEPDDADAHLVLASIYGLQGRTEDAAEVVADWLQKHPHFTTKHVMRSERYAIRSWQEQVVKALRAAGLPD
jgi:tetratricopeptide (TPR) repeat protein